MPLVVSLWHGRNGQVRHSRDMDAAEVQQLKLTAGGTTNPLDSLAF